MCGISKRHWCSPKAPDSFISILHDCIDLHIYKAFPSLKDLSYTLTIFIDRIRTYLLSVTVCILVCRLYLPVWISIFLVSGHIKNLCDGPLVKNGREFAKPHLLLPTDMNDLIWQSFTTTIVILLSHRRIFITVGFISERPKQFHTISLKDMSAWRDSHIILNIPIFDCSKPKRSQETL